MGLLAVSCAKEVPSQDENPGSGLTTVSFTASSAATKTSLGTDGLSVEWKATDKISVFDDSSAAGNEFTTAGSGSEVVFSGEIGVSATEYYGLYPYDANAVWDNSGKVITTTLSHKQVCAPGTFPDATVISAAKAVDGEMFFTNICSLVKFEITSSDIKEVIIKANNAEKIAGKLSIEFDAAGVPSYKALEMGEQWSKIQVKPESGDVFAPGTYYAVLLPSQLKQGLSINVIKTDNKVYSKFNKSALAVRVGHIVSIGALETNLVYDRDVTNVAALTTGRTLDRTLLYTVAQTNIIKGVTSGSAKEAVGFVNTRANGITSLDPNASGYETSVKSNPAPDDAFYTKASNHAFVVSNVFVAGCIASKGSIRTGLYTPTIDLMYNWASACANVEYTVSTGNPGSGSILARAFFPFFQIYEMIRGGGNWGTTDKYAAIDAWFLNMADAMKRTMALWNENDYFDKQYFSNQIAALDWGILSIGVALKDPDLVYYATESIDNPRNFYDLLQGCILVPGDYVCPRESADATVSTTGEIYDRYRHKTGPNKGLQYTSLTLQILSTMARTLKNNGIDAYAYTCPTGENLKQPYEFYAPFYAAKDDSLGDGYYSGEASRIGAAGDMLGLFELGYNAYPSSTAIQSVITAMGTKRAENKVQMHQQLGYTRLLSIDVDATN